jgi:two-component system chemotaxis response regulator CheB
VHIPTEGVLYTVPADYHVLLESDLSLSLDVSEAVNYSRPSIDIYLNHFLCFLKDKCLEFYYRDQIEDGAGLKIIAKNNGRTIIQDCTRS